MFRRILRYGPGEQGFTLMEMVVAVFIVGVMMAVATPYIAGAGQRAETTACEQNQRMIRAALSEYDLLYHQYPSGNSLQQLQELQAANILESVPRDPGGGNYVIADSDPNNVSVSCDVHGELGKS
ncbi:MAG: prepilin-type N-terminal cleavage/methylation domain-containing protein [Alicyclobacillus sp.]|nr:prepilin-type N-terminal cleavage/methylation domain-containing protein [Alicyclobacillus sp.]